MFSVKVEGVLRLCKMSKSIGPRASWSIEKSGSKYLIKPVELWSFLSPKRKMASKMIKKHYVFTINHMASRHVEKPYKTCRKWRLLRAHFRPSGRPERAGRPAKAMVPAILFFCPDLVFLSGQKKRSHMRHFYFVRTKILSALRR